MMVQILKTRNTRLGRLCDLVRIKQLVRGGAGFEPCLTGG